MNEINQKVETIIFVFKRYVIKTKLINKECIQYTCYICYISKTNVGKVELTFKTIFTRILISYWKSWEKL